MRLNDLSFFKKHALFNLPLLTILLILAYLIFNNEIVLGILVGYLLCSIHTVIGYFSFEYSFSKSNTTFLKYYFGGMMVRLFLLLFLVFFIVKYIGININSLLFSLLIFYLINLVLELQHIIKRQNRLI
ncbi:MAG: ATP synthase subunit I [Bacteroidetes bacterium]|nr:ATP synthase subunit I [Bacteroidota bacterium]MBU2583923.1 ATP synthase subunit I [Bacteroidota bacterium]